MEIYMARNGAYIARDSFDYKDELKAAGFRYDGDGRYWFTYSARAVLELPGHVGPTLLAKLQAEAATEAEATAKADAALPLLRPAGTLASQSITDVSVTDKIIRIQFAPRDEKFRGIVKKASFKWANTAWERTTTQFTGSPQERAADIARQLLEAGYTVRVRDAEAHARAISGEYEDEQTRWVAALTSGPKKGWLRVSWHYDDDMYPSAKRLPGANYEPPCTVVCPPDSVADVLDFAARHGFSVTESARAVLAAREAELSRGVVVVMAPRKKKEPAQAPSGKPPKLAVVAAEIDDDLLDND